jgi:curved DNA-binding protein CbpA
MGSCQWPRSETAAAWITIPGAARSGGGDGEPPSDGATRRDEGVDKLLTQVREVFSDLDRKNYYELLGVGPGADRKELRAAYFVLSKQYHPDKAFGPGRDELRRMMEVIFGRLTQAYDTLTGPTQRAEYDAYIADQIDLWKIEQQLKDAVERKGPESRTTPAPGEGGADRARPGNSVAVRTTPVVRTTVHPPRRAVQSVSSKPAVRRPVPQSDPGIPDPGRTGSDPDLSSRREQWKRERLGRALGMVISGNSVAPAPRRSPETEEKVEQANIALERAEYVEATRILQEVLKADPDNAVAAGMMARAKEGAAQSLASGHVRQGRYEWKNGFAERAIGSFERALASDPGSHEARHLLAEVLLEQRRELPRALALCRELIAMGGQRARYFATLGELLLLAKETRRAQDAFERALAIEPENREYRKRLKACKS